MMKTEYRIIRSTDLGLLADRVNFLITEGWYPQGGVSTACNAASTTFYAQAMILEKK